MIDLAPDGYVALGTESTVAVLEAKRIITARLPRTEAEAADVETIGNYVTPALKRTNVQRALKEIPGAQFVGKGEGGRSATVVLTVDCFCPNFNHIDEQKS